MILSAYIKNLIEKLSGIYEFNEAKSISNILISYVLEFSNTDIILNSSERISEEKMVKLDELEKRIMLCEPIQYIMGHTFFYGLKFFVDKNVLIPRQDTEIIVDDIVKNYSKANNLKILDICSGTGCIAIALKKNIPEANVFAIEISDKAIEIMKKNCIENDTTDIEIYKYDILSDKKFPFKQEFDLIISNPPYILENEKSQIHKNIINFEPEIALFVKDSDPLIFYRKILEKVKKNSNKKTKIYFECNQKFIYKIIQLCEYFGFKYDKIIKDFNENDRFIILSYFAENK